MKISELIKILSEIKEENIDPDVSIVVDECNLDKGSYYGSFYLKPTNHIEYNNEIVQIFTETLE
jgi:hypothetical protein